MKSHETSVPPPGEVQSAGVLPAGSVSRWRAGSCLFWGGKSSWTIMESENHILRNADCLVWFLIVFCCQSMFRVPTGWLALGKVCESRDPKFTWEGVECIRYFQAGLPGKGAISVTNVADDLAGHVPAFWQCRFACGFEHHSFCFYTYPLVN